MKSLLFFNWIWPWRSRLITLQNNRHLNQDILRIWSKFSYPNFNVVELWCGQAENRVNFDFGIKCNLKVQNQSLPKTIGILTKVFCTSGPNLATLTWMGHKLSHGQATGCHTDGRTHTHNQTQATTMPRGQNWPQVIKTHWQRMCTYMMKRVKQSRPWSSLGSHGCYVFSRVACVFILVVDTRTHTQTDTGKDSTWRLKLAFGKNTFQNKHNIHFISYDSSL